MSKNKKAIVAKPHKVETIQEYLARGGTINRIPEAKRDPVPDVIRKTNTGGSATFLSVEEADLYYGETRKGVKPKKTKPSLKIDLSVLPPALRTKFVTKLKEDVSGEEYEEELEEVSQEE